MTFCLGASCAATGGEKADVPVRLEGNLPGGTITLSYRFGLGDGVIHALTISM